MPLDTMTDRVVIPTPPRYGVGPLDITDGIDWAALNSRPVSFQWWINTLAFVEEFLRGRNADPSLAERLVKEWYDANPVANPQSNRAWDGHSAALRSKYLADLYKLIPGAPWLRDCIEEHGRFLASKEHYQGGWNHGLDQDIGLLYLAQAVNSSDWRSLACNRALAAINVMVDSQGVTGEQSVNYQKYNHYQIKRYLPILESHGAVISEDLRTRHRAMPLMLAHATCPDGTYEVLGDTTLQEAQFIDGAEADFAASRAKQGRLPQDTHKVFDAGFVFGRSGWGIEREFSKESFYSVRFGPGRMFHGHHDHTSLTLRPQGHRLIVDTGVNGYTEDRWKEYFRSHRAHNVVVAEGARKFAGSASTELSRHSIEDGFQFYELQDRPYAGVKRVRRLLFVGAPDVVVVVDNLVASIDTTFAQLWHFAPEASIDIDERVVNIGGLPIEARLHQLLTFDSISTASGETDPIQGWVCEGLYERKPNAVVATRSRGKRVAFISVFVMGEGANHSSAHFQNRSMAHFQRVHPGVRGRVTVAREGRAELIVDLLTDGRLRPHL